MGPHLLRSIPSASDSHIWPGPVRSFSSSGHDSYSRPSLSTRARAHHIHTHPKERHGSAKARLKIQRCPPPAVRAPRRQSRPPSTGSSPPNTGTQERHQGPAEYSSLANLHYDHNLLSSLAPPLEGSPAAVPVCQPFDTLPESAHWAEPDLSFDTDWNFISVNHQTPYPPGYDGGDVPVLDLGYGSAFTSLSDSGPEYQNYFPASLVPSSANSPQDGRSHPSPVSQFPAPVSTSFPSPATSQGDDALSRVDSSRVEKRKLNTLAARRCRQRRVDRMKDLEEELEKVRKERDELRLRCSKLEGETDALKGLLTRKA
ncbi:uncharacterized protein N7515_009603 [Penicillium bovifimosum]|uniref:BZIP domain-containing protein n=1 Tax=Penicillium bovifimosum TaxID=126998 RepID=A0A9W9KVP2_9EURO|nr:uncharacterized protein N7515_009603 [Penicillium bovifimosum]KAJ5121642.1 hypothetical protein N7515_009603 [Penicillium bovifimosum]